MDKHTMTASSALALHHAGKKIQEGGRLPFENISAVSWPKKRASEKS